MLFLMVLLNPFATFFKALYISAQEYFVMSFTYDVNALLDIRVFVDSRITL